MLNGHCVWTEKCRSKSNFSSDMNFKCGEKCLDLCSCKIFIFSSAHLLQTSFSWWWLIPHSYYFSVKCWTFTTIWLLGHQTCKNKNTLYSSAVGGCCRPRNASVCCESEGVHWSTVSRADTDLTHPPLCWAAAPVLWCLDHFTELKKFPLSIHCSNALYYDCITW